MIIYYATYLVHNILSYNIPIHYWGRRVLSKYTAGTNEPMFGMITNKPEDVARRLFHIQTRTHKSSVYIHYLNKTLSVDNAQLSEISKLEIPG